MATPDDLVHCPICLEIFIEPRALSCLHSFCDICLQEYINTAARSATVANGFDCPVCRRNTPAPSPAVNGHSEWSKLFPLNHILIKLLDARVTDNATSGNTPDSVSVASNTPVPTSEITENSKGRYGQGANDSRQTDMQARLTVTSAQGKKGLFPTTRDSRTTKTASSISKRSHRPSSQFPTHGPPHQGNPFLHRPPHQPCNPLQQHCQAPPQHQRTHLRGWGFNGSHSGPNRGLHPRGPRGRFPLHGPHNRHPHPPF